MTEPPPFRVGIAGRSPAGQFLVERLKVRPEYEISAVSLANPVSKLDAVLFLDGNAASAPQIQEALDAGLPVGVLPPLFWEPASCEQLAEQAAGRLFVLNPHHEDPDFRAARELIQTGELGLLRAIKRISWVADLVNSSPQSDQDTWFSQLLWEDVDQLLLLAEELPRSVYAADYSEKAETYFLIFHFPSGLIGHVERRRGSVVPLDVGWTISGQNGSYANGRHHIQTEAGEIYDVPAEADPLSGDAIFDPLRRFGESSADSSWQQAVNVIKVRRAAVRSAETGQVVALPFD